MSASSVNNERIGIKIRHQQILELLEGIKSGIHRYLAIKPLLNKFQDILFEHINSQNKIFDNVSLRSDKLPLINSKHLEFLIVDLKDIKIQSLMFFDAHPAGMNDIKPGNFISDFQVFSVRITERLRAENEYLIPILEVINDAKN